jgi:lytic cellulose monooxygenase (C1-hydroxylating)
MYPGCVQINISGGGSASPPKVALPGAYKGSDPGITVNIYNNLQVSRIRFFGKVI